MPRLRYDTRRVVLEVVAVSLVVGAVVGWLWTLLAPDVRGMVTDDGVLAVGIVEAAGLFPREAVLASLCAGAGVLLAVYYTTRFRIRPVSTVLALVAGGAAGTAVAVGVGRFLGPGDAAGRAAQAGAGEELVMPLSLDAYGLLAAWPLAVAVIAAVVALVRDDRNPWGTTGRSQARPMGASAADVR